jgi:hypothetical protein
MAIDREIHQLQEVVEYYLRRDVRYRDCDKTLCARIWSEQLGGLEAVKNTTAYEFFCEYIKPNGRLYSQESIGRARRKLQEDFPELRGENYREKQNKTKDVQAVLGYKI